MNIFDATQYIYRPTVPLPGTLPITVIGDWGLFPAGVDRTKLPPVGIVKDIAAMMYRAGAVACIDCEVLPVALLGQLVDMFHDAEPSLRIGFYGELPQWDNDLAVNAGTQWIIDRFNQRAVAIATTLASKVDLLFPNLYLCQGWTLAQWQAFAAATLKFCRTLNKPVYPFLWPRLDPRNGQGGDYIDEPTFSAILSTCSAMSDGAVIWSEPGVKFDDSWGWWQAIEGVK